MSPSDLPAPDTEAIHVHGAGGQTGPMSRRVLKQKLEAGEISPTDHFWFDGLDGWKTIDSQSALLEELEVPEAPSGPTPGQSEDDYLDSVFGDLVQSSWDYFNAHAFASHVDEVFLGAVITSTLDSGYALIDLNSDGDHHFLRFEDLQDHSRIVYRLTHLTQDLTQARVLGQRGEAVVGYGERVKNFAKVWKALQSEWKSGYMRNTEPGTITVDGDMQSGYIYVQVVMFWDIDEYVDGDYSIEYDKLKLHVGACVHALRKYLRGRFA